MISSNKPEALSNEKSSNRASPFLRKHPTENTVKEVKSSSNSKANY